MSVVKACVFKVGSLWFARCPMGSAASNPGVRERLGWADSWPEAMQLAHVFCGEREHVLGVEHDVAQHPVDVHVLEATADALMHADLLYHLAEHPPTDDEFLMFEYIHAALEAWDVTCQVIELFKESE